MFSLLLHELQLASSDKESSEDQDTEEEVSARKQSSDKEQSSDREAEEDGEEGQKDSGYEFSLTETTILEVVMDSMRTCGLALALQALSTLLLGRRATSSACFGSSAIVER